MSKSSQSNEAQRDEGSKGTTVKNRVDNLMPLFPHTVLGTGQRLRVMLGLEQTAMAGRRKQAEAWAVGPAIK